MEQINELLNFLNRYTKLSEGEIQFVKEHTPIRQVEKNHVLLKEGKISKEFYFIVKGCVRLYYLSNGEEKTAYFYTENMFVSSYESFTRQIPAKHNLVTLEDTSLVVFSVDSVPKFLGFSPKFEFLARVIMEEELSTYQKIISSFITQNAEERYLATLKNDPELLQRIPQHQIATYLGVSPETLSRIRKRIVDN